MIIIIIILGVEPLLLHTDRSLLRCFRYMIKMPHGRLPLEAFSGISYCYETPKFQVLLHYPSGLGIIQDPSEKVLLEREMSGFPSWTWYLCNPINKGKTMEEWIQKSE
ncbi:hypothetical protein ILYODFUR_033150 [Ilyodon furcidens]|uniref:Uncharacterized protein n=1 Tax=Ilyodon furcidens TaxID=33524 RepID=A0ABV0UCE1_9TELE